MPLINLLLLIIPRLGYLTKFTDTLGTFKQ